MGIYGTLLVLFNGCPRGKDQLHLQLPIRWLGLGLVGADGVLRGKWGEGQHFQLNRCDQVFRPQGWQAQVARQNGIFR